MKKILSLVLTLMMLAIPALTMAEGGYSTYIDPNGVFGFSYPDGWTLLNQETVEEALKAAAERDATYQAAVEGYAAMVQGSGIVMLIHPNGLNNISVICQNVGAEMNGELLQTLMAPAVKEQLTGMGATLVEDPSLLDVGSKQALYVPYTITASGVEMLGVQTYLSLGANMCICTLTAVDDLDASTEALGFVLGSLVAQ